MGKKEDLYINYDRYIQYKLHHVVHDGKRPVFKAKHKTTIHMYSNKQRAA